MQVRVDVDAAVESMSVRDGEAAGESANEALGMYRIVEQALLNAAAHGQARQVQVSVSRQARDGVDGIRVQVSDDGVGFDPAAATDGGGFAISQVWARLLGGQFTVRSEPGQGATASAWLPEAVDAVP
jgi:signal transduction histidine kinase